MPFSFSYGKKRCYQQLSEGEEVNRVKKQKQIKDPKQTKRTLSGFLWFSKDEKENVKKNNPEFKFKEIAKELRRRWNESPKNIREKYIAMASKNGRRYSKEMVSYHLNIQEVASGPLYKS